MRHRAAVLVAALLLNACAAANTTPVPTGNPGAGATAAASARDHADVVAVMNRLFAAMRTQDTATIRAISHPALRLFVPGEQNGAPALRTSTLDDFIRSIAASQAVLDEVAHDPEVRVDGNLATIWTYYDFVRGDQFSHCGFDAFHLARGTAGWTIIGLAYTTRTDGCRPRQ